MHTFFKVLLCFLCVVFFVMSLICSSYWWNNVWFYKTFWFLNNETTGTIETMSNGSRKKNQSCDKHKDCDGFKLGKAGTLACCNRECKTQLKNWAGIGMCSYACGKKFNGPLGTCD